MLIYNARKYNQNFLPNFSQRQIKEREKKKRERERERMNK